MISSSIVVPPSLDDLFAKPRIGYHSLIPESVLTVSSAETDNPKELLENYFTYDAWQATGAGAQWVEIRTTNIESVDYIGIAAHNLATAGASFVTQYWDGAAWQDAHAQFLPQFNSPLIYEFLPVVSNRFRFYIINSTSPVYIGVLFIGRIMHLERGVYVGHQVATYNRSDRILNSESEGGQFLGRSTISEGGQTNIDLKHLSPAWLRSDWVPFQDHARLKPFFFSWLPQLYPYEVIYGWSTSTPVPTVAGHNFYSVSIGMQGLIGPGVLEAS
jgi:hypothetical protein